MIRSSHTTTSVTVNNGNHNELIEDEIVENKVKFVINIGNSSNSIRSSYRPYRGISVNSNDVNSADSHNICNKNVKENFNNVKGDETVIYDDHNNDSMVHSDDENESESESESDRMINIDENDEIGCDDGNENDQNETTIENQSRHSSLFESRDTDHSNDDYNHSRSIDKHIDNHDYNSDTTTYHFNNNNNDDDDDDDRKIVSIRDDNEVDNNKEYCDEKVSTDETHQYLKDLHLAGSSIFMTTLGLRTVKNLKYS